MRSSSRFSRTKTHAFVAGALLGLAGGIGAVVLPRPLGLTPNPTSRTLRTSLLTVALYTAGGLAAAGVAAARLPAATDT